MLKKKNINNKIRSDEALSRSLWRKSCSIDDEDNTELYKQMFLNYQREEAQEYAKSDVFPACVANCNLRIALTKLTKKQQNMVKLYFFDNLTQQDIADLLGCERSGVAKVLKRAINKLHTLLLSGCEF